MKRRNKTEVNEVKEIYELNNFEFGIRVIFGKFGVGKGTLNTILAINEMRCQDLYLSACGEIQLLEEHLGRSFSYPPEPHVVFSNFKIHDFDNNIASYDFEPDKFMLPNEEIEYTIYPPYSCFHVEEAQSESFCSYDWSKFPKPALLAFARIRHPNYIFTLDLQFIENLNNNLRKYAFEYLTPIGMEHKTNLLNVLVETKEYVAVLKNYENAVDFEVTGNMELVDEVRVYVFKGCIFDCFDSYGKKLGFFENSEGKDFEYEIKQKRNFKGKITEIIL